MSDPAADALRTTSDVLALAAAALPPPLGIVARILSAAAGAASVAVDSGRTEAEVVASIRRIDAIDVAGQDAAADARIAARREAERTERGDEPTREIPPDLSLGAEAAVNEPTQSQVREAERHHRFVYCNTHALPTDGHEAAAAAAKRARKAAKRLASGRP